MNDHKAYDRQCEAKKRSSETEQEANESKVCNRQNMSRNRSVRLSKKLMSVKHVTDRI